MKRDSLVHVAATGGYASVFEVSDGVCEVGLIDPLADDYSIRVPQGGLEEMEPATDADRERLLGRLVLLHLRVSRSLDLRRGFEAYVSRNEDDDLELWFAAGTSRAERSMVLDPTRGASLVDAVRPLALDAWADGGTGPDVATLDGWGWSVQMVGGGMGQAAFGHPDPADPDDVPAGLHGLVDALSGLGLPVCWGDDGPRVDGSRHA